MRMATESYRPALDLVRLDVVKFLSRIAMQKAPNGERIAAYIEVAANEMPKGARQRLAVVVVIMRMGNGVVHKLH